MRMSSFRIAALLAVVSAGLGPTAATAAEGVVEALSSWEARGHIYPTGTDEATFVGLLSGVVYVKADDAALDISELDTALITCPSSVEIDMASGTALGRGKCVILTPDAERIYAKFECSGKFLQGCRGNFEFTGGTGERANISGGGPIQLKSAFGQLAVTPGAVVEQSAVGLAVWPKLTYKLP
ncbi:MAG: hypothetical protein ACU85V_00355 [Gammaproteobacteria bacterium]